MIIFEKFQRGRILAPEGDGAAGGGGGDGGAATLESHDADAGALYGEAPAAGAAAAGGDDDGEDSSAAGDAGKAAADKAAADAKAKGEKKPAPQFSPFVKKKDAAAETKAADAGADLPEDKIQLGDKAGADTTTHFKTLKGITKQVRAEKSALEAEIATLRKSSNSSTPSPEMEKLRAEHKALSDRLAVVDLQNHPDYVRQYVEPKNKLVAGISSVLADNKVEGVDVASLLSKPRPEFAKAVSEIAAKLPAFEQSAFLADMRQIHNLDSESKVQLGKGAELAAALQRKTDEANRAAFDETYKSLDFSPENIPPLEIPDGATADEKAGIEAYNKAVGELRTNAEQIAFGKTDEKGVATTATKAVAFDFIRTHAIPRMEAQFSQARELIQTLTAEITSLKAVRNGGGGGGGGNNDGEDEGHEAAAGKAWRR